MKHLVLFAVMFFSCFFISCTSQSTNPKNTKKEIVRKENFLEKRQELRKKINNILSLLKWRGTYSLNDGVIHYNYVSRGRTVYEWGSAHNWDNSYHRRINLWNQEINIEVLKDDVYRGVYITGKDKKLKIKAREGRENSFKEEVVDGCSIYSFRNEDLTIKKMEKLKDLLKKYSELKKENK